MLDVLSFIKNFIDKETIIPFTFLLIILFIKYIYMPWDKLIKETNNVVNDLDRYDHDRLEKISENINVIIHENKNLLADIDKKIDKLLIENSQEHQILRDSTEEIKKILVQLTKIEKIIEDISKNIIQRLEHVKDEGKDSKFDFSQQMFSIKQEIADLKSKIEPLLFVSRGIK